MVVDKMKKSVVLIFVNIVIVFGTEHVPVLVWEAKGGIDKRISDLPSLSKLSSEEFSDLFVKKLSGKKGPQPLIAVFVEENLSIEDFSWQNSEGRTGFPHLENLTSSAKHVKFYPAVHAPLKGLKRLGYRWQTLQLEDQENDLSLPSGGGVILVVKLGDARIDEDRPDFLKRHDYVISEIYNDLLAKNKDVIAVYTSHHSSWVEPPSPPLVRRVRSVSNSEEFTFWNDTDVMFYSSELPTFNPDSADPSKVINVTVTLCTKDTRKSPQTETLRCKFGDNHYSLELRFTLSEYDYWYLSVYVTENQVNSNQTLLKSNTEIYAPLGFSYHCSQEVVFKNGSMVLTFKNFQVQAYATSNTFDDAYDCVWFFTVPIWAGLMVTALLGIILMIGLAAIMDINTMDRFDDPKGKAITINASD